MGTAGSGDSDPELTGGAMLQRRWGGFRNAASAAADSSRTPGLAHRIFFINEVEEGQKDSHCVQL